jgi:hypothetical protein
VVKPLYTCALRGKLFVFFQSLFRGNFRWFFNLASFAALAIFIPANGVHQY